MMPTEPRPQVSTPQASRRIRAAGLALLVAWSAVGIFHSGEALVAATGARLGPAAPTVGAPTPMTPAVQAVRVLLPAPTGGGRWLVLVPPDSPPVFRTYLHYQLAYLHYPGLVRVVSVDDRFIADPYAGIIAPAGLELPGDWRPTGEHGALRRWERESR